MYVYIAAFLASSASAAVINGTTGCFACLSSASQKTGGFYCSNPGGTEACDDNATPVPCTTGTAVTDYAMCGATA